ncbi:MAG: hypothetical protein M1838_000757 [Thelocarpon superellum]|nr:MAG: hypothetical protein M1838_000757 [Thelocarpon superellum]
MAGLGAADAIDTGLQISEQILKLSMRYLVGVKDAREDIKRVRNEVLSLQDNLVDLKDLADDPDPAALSSLGLLNQPDGALQQCQELLKQLAAGLELGQDEDEMKRFGLRALKWPLSTKAVERALKVLRDYQDKFGLAVNRDHLRLSREIKNTVTHVDKRVVAMQTQQETLLSSEYRRQIDKWLSAPDPSSNHNAAREKRQGHTGAWFTEGSQYASWKVNPTSFLWLHGIPGNGKSVLCSTIIEDITQHCHPKPDNVVIYFYFDFNDKEKQGHHGLMRSLVKQLSMQLPSTSPAIKVILSHCQGQQPTTEVLLSIFRQMLDEFRQTFVVIDALDECTDREKLMDLLTSVLVWRYENLRLLVTSRREKDIEDALAPLSQGCQTDLRNASVDDDIRAYIQERLRKDARLSKQVEVVRNEIQTVLMDGAHGMYESAPSFNADWAEL